VYNASHIQTYDAGTNNRWNISGSPHGYGNYWSDWTTPDADSNGVVDIPYSIPGSAGAKDYYPLTLTSVSRWPLDEGSGQYANDTSGHDNDGILGSSGGVDSNDPAWASGISGKALAFNGKNFVTIPDDASLNPSFISVEAWVNPANYGYYRSFVTKNYGSSWSSPYVEYSLWLQDNTAKPSFILTIGGGTGTGATSVDPIPMNQWSYLVGTYDGNSTKIYVNGILKGTGASPIPGAPIASRPYPLYIGPSSLSNHNYYGMIDEVSIWNRSLAPEEVLEHYYDGLGGPVHNIDTNLYFDTIQAAIDDPLTTNGHTITVCAGTYNEHVTVNKGINLVGNGSADTIIDGGGTGDVVHITADWVNMTGFKLIGSGSNAVDAGIHLDSVQYCRIENNAATNNLTGVYLYDSSGNSVSNNNCSNNDYGIWLASSSSSNTLNNNNCSNNDYGIFLQSSSNVNTLINNNCNMNAQTGIYLQSSSNTLNNNTCSNNGWGGVFLQSSSSNTLSNNNCSNNDYGIYLYMNSNSNTLNNNTCSNSWAGIYLELSSNSNTLNNNTMSSNDYGIYLQVSSSNTLDDNNCSNSDYGIYLNMNSNSNTLINNTCLSNTNDGIEISASSGNTLINNTCSDNGRGMYLGSSSGNTISNNTCISNNGEGIILELSSGNTLSNNTCISNSGYGMYLAFSGNNDLANNTCSNNQRGIFLYSNSNNNMIRGNVLLWNNLEGVCVETAAGNRIWNNTFAFNNGSALLYDLLHIQAYESGTGNWWNSTTGYGNWWADWTTPDNFAPFGIVDFVYYISGTSGARDYYPQTHAVTPPYDFLPPTATANISGVIGSDGWYISSVDIVLNASDNAGGSGVEVIKFRIDGAAWLDYSSPFNMTSDGNHVLEFYAVDHAGNDGTRGSLVIKVDRTPPSLSIDQANGTVFTSSSVDMSWTASDSMSGLDRYEFSLDGGMWLSPADNTTTLIPLSGLSNGTHRFDLKAMDHAGNIVERNISFFVDIVLAPPEDFNISVGGGGGGANIVLTWSAVSGADHYSIYISTMRNGFDLDSPSATTTSISWTHFNANLIGDGNYSQEYFYLVRAVGTSGIEDSNINILGKHTYELEGATGGRWNQFALALEPLTSYTADSLADAIQSCDGIAWFNQTSQQWTFHATAMPAGVFDTTMETATGYQVSINNASSVQFTLVGR